MGSSAFAKAFTSLLGDAENWRVTHRDDVVPHLPQEDLGYLHTPREAYQKDEVKPDLIYCSDSASQDDDACRSAVLPFGLHVGRRPPQLLGPGAGHRRQGCIEAWNLHPGDGVAAMASQWPLVCYAPTPKCSRAAIVEIVTLSLVRSSPATRASDSLGPPPLLQSCPRRSAAASSSSATRSAPPCFRHQRILVDPRSNL